MLIFLCFSFAIIRICEAPGLAHPCLGYESKKQCAYYGIAACISEEKFPIRTTLSGLTCQAWRKQKPQGHHLARLGTSDTDNRCAGFGEKAPWCYAIDTVIRWEYCYPRCTVVPSCLKSDAKSGKECVNKGSTICKTRDVPYPATKTKSGIECQAWKQQTPHSHLFSNLVESDSDNRCYVNTEDVPWCFTTDPKIAFQFCYPWCACTTGCTYCEVDLTEVNKDADICVEEGRADCSSLKPGQAMFYETNKICCKPSEVATCHKPVKCGGTNCKVTKDRLYCVVAREGSTEAQCPDEKADPTVCSTLEIGEEILISHEKICCHPYNPNKCERKAVKCGSENCKFIPGKQYCVQDKEGLGAKCMEADREGERNCSELHRGDSIQFEVGESVKWCCRPTFAQGSESETKCPLKCGDTFCSTTWSHGYCEMHDNEPVKTKCPNETVKKGLCLDIGIGETIALTTRRKSGALIQEWCCKPSASPLHCEEGIIQCGSNHRCGSKTCLQEKDQGAVCPLSGHVCFDLVLSGTLEKRINEDQWCCAPTALVKESPEKKLLTACPQTAVKCNKDFCSSTYCIRNRDEEHQCGTVNSTETDSSCAMLGPGQMKIMDGSKRNDLKICCVPDSDGKCGGEAYKCGNDFCTNTEKKQYCIQKANQQIAGCNTKNQTYDVCKNLKEGESRQFEEGWWCCRPKFQEGPTGCDKTALFCGKESCSYDQIDTHRYCEADLTAENGNETRCPKGKRNKNCKYMAHGDSIGLTVPREIIDLEKTDETQDMEFYVKHWCCKPESYAGNCSRDLIQCGKDRHCKAKSCIADDEDNGGQTRCPTQQEQQNGHCYGKEDFHTYPTEKRIGLKKWCCQSTANLTLLLKSTSPAAPTTATSCPKNAALCGTKTCISTYCIQDNQGIYCDDKKEHQSCGTLPEGAESRISEELWCCRPGSGNEPVETCGKTSVFCGTPCNATFCIGCCNPDADGYWKCPRKAVQCGDKLCDRPRDQSYCTQKPGGSAQCATLDNQECSNRMLGTEKRISSTTWCCRPSEVGNTSTSCPMKEDRRSQWCNNALCPKYTYCLRDGNDTSCPTSLTHLDTCNYVTGEKWVNESKWCCRPNNEFGICPGTATPVPIGPPLSSCDRNSYSMKMTSIAFLLSIFFSGSTA